MTGIYKITNTKNNKIYVGSSSNLERRYYYHLNYLRNNKHSNVHLQRAYNIDSEESFEFSVIEECDGKILIEREEYYMVFLNSLDDRYGYNINPKGDRPPSWLGKHHREETKLKMSISQEGKICSQHSKDVASLTHKGKTISDEHIEGLRIRNSGEGNPMFGRTPYDIWTEKYGKEIADQKQMEWDEKRNKNIPRGENNHMFGTTLYDIWLEKYGKEEADIRYDKWRNRIVSEETKEKLRKKATGKKAKDSTRKKMSDKRQGELNNACKIKNKELPKILKMIDNGVSIKDIADKYGVCTVTIRNIKKGKRKI